MSFTVYRDGTPLVEFAREFDARLYCAEWAAKGHSGCYYIGVPQVTGSVHELQLLEELDTLQGRIEELQGLLEDERSTSAFLSDLLDDWFGKKLLDEVQIRFLNDQYGTDTS